MKRLSTFILRAVLSAFFAVVLARFFFPNASLTQLGLMGLFMLGMAYTFEYLGNRNSD